MSDIYFLPTKYGKKIAVHEKHVFHREKTVNNRTYWKCVQVNKGCKSRITLVDDKFEKISGQHNHPPDSNALIRRKFKIKVEERVRQEGYLLPVPRIYKEEAAKAAAVSDDLALAIPSYRNIQKTLYRTRRAFANVSLLPTVHNNSDDDFFEMAEDLPSNSTDGAGKSSRFSVQTEDLQEEKKEESIFSTVGATSTILSMNTEQARSTSSSSASYHFPNVLHDDSMVVDDPIDILMQLTENAGKPSTSSTRKGLLERLKDNVVIGDGGFVFSLEKRGYVKAGPWTPEAAVEHPEAVRNLHREFLRAGSDVMQAFTFYASDDKLINRGNEAGKLYTGSDINEAACKIAREVADEGDALVAGGISQTPTYLSNKGKASVQAEFRKQVEVFVKNNVDFLICEYFEHIEEMEWAIQVCKETSLPVAATMCIGAEGDLHDVSAGECAVRMAKAGADVVGLNCHFDPFKTLETIAIMKKALEAQDLKPYLMTQPLAFHTPDAGKQGFIDLPEFPFALEPRVCTRWDMQRYAREAYELGVRFIGGCCGFESYHIRAVSEELAKERGKLPESSKKHEPWGEGLKMHTKPWVRARARKDYWQNINPSTGRPFSAAFSKPDNWGVTAGSEDLKQKAESTTKEELQKVFARSAK